jgi:hypothetical protein
MKSRESEAEAETRHGREALRHVAIWSFAYCAAIRQTHAFSRRFRAKNRAFSHLFAPNPTLSHHFETFFYPKKP